MSKISEISYLGNLRTVATHLKSGVQIITDAPPDNHGRGEAFYPTDLVSTGLGNCMITLMGITANAHNITLGKIDAEVQKIMGSNPRRIIEIVIDFRIENLDFTEKQKQLLEYAALNCPVAKSLSPEILQTVSFTYY
jgi:uncharacterized OsmC-like protein